VQRRRDLPTRVTQLVQRGVQRQMFGAAGDPVPPRGVPVPLRLLSRVPPLLRLFSRFMAIGIRNEHVDVALLGAGAPRAHAPAPQGQAQRGEPEPEVTGRGRVGQLR
jgi:hypothetical protein